MLLAERLVQWARRRRPTHRSALARCTMGRCVCLSNDELVLAETRTT